MRWQDKPNWTWMVTGIGAAATTGYLASASALPSTLAWLYAAIAMLLFVIADLAAERSTNQQLDDPDATPAQWKACYYRWFARYGLLAVACTMVVNLFLVWL